MVTRSSLLWWICFQSICTASSSVDSVQTLACVDVCVCVWCWNLPRFSCRRRLCYLCLSLPVVVPISLLFTEVFIWSTAARTSVSSIIFRVCKGKQLTPLQIPPPLSPPPFTYTHKSFGELHSQIVICVFVVVLSCKKKALKRLKREDKTRPTSKERSVAVVSWTFQLYWFVTFLMSFLISSIASSSLSRENSSFCCMYINKLQQQ